MINERAAREAEKFWLWYYFDAKWWQRAIMPMWFYAYIKKGWDDDQ